LINIKSKEDLIGDILLLLQSPMKNLVSSLQSGGSTLSGLLKALEERAQ
jgi:large subunit ribosomal protein L10